MFNLHRILSIAFFIVFFILPISANTVLEVTEDDFVVGDKNAPVTIIEYASLSCSHCADFHNNTLEDLIKEYVDTGKARIVFRDFPFNYPALIGSMVLRCIPEDVRYDYMNALFQLQPKWVVRENAKSTQELYKIMQSGGMTKEEFETCTNNVELENTILQALIAAQNEFNIQSTPSFLINGNLVEGNKSIKEFRQIIDKILSE
ncbi:MAG: Disulfide bond formation protein D [Alphaproteobacteria bacterium MarineAlpha5_Bin2]|jgi:protein-disulfide isomerase|nr:MAG: Disulfide bond formation protein D [Alphaproteobacteria bacterium MarineAlpha5_Bin2]